jgi:hypothetical protein
LSQGFKETLFSNFRIWENRERKKAKEYERAKEKELKREEKREKEAKIMKEFLEDYDDERDDPKYYKFVLFHFKFSLFILNFNFSEEKLTRRAWLTAWPKLIQI